jgi:uncharacterized protein
VSVIASFADLTFTETPDGVTIPIRALPRARRTALDGVIDGALRVRLAAPPVEGAANKAILQYLAEVLGVPKRDLDLVSGEQGRHKLVRVRGLSSDEVRQRLAAVSR